MPIYLYRDMTEAGGQSRAEGVVWLRIQLLESNCTTTERILSLLEMPLGRLQSLALSLQMTHKAVIQGIFCRIFLQSSIKIQKCPLFIYNLLFSWKQGPLHSLHCTMPFSALMSSIVAAAARFHTCMLTAAPAHCQLEANRAVFPSSTATWKCWIWLERQGNEWPKVLYSILLSQGFLLALIGTEAISTPLPPE